MVPVIARPKAVAIQFSKAQPYSTGLLRRCRAALAM